MAHIGGRPRIHLFDTNAFDQMNRLIRTVISPQLLDIGQQRVRFLGLTRRLLAILTQDGTSRIRTTSSMYAEEIDLRDPGSRLRTADPHFIGTLFDDPAFVESVAGALEAFLEIEEVEDAECDALTLHLQTDPGRCDRGLICLALRHAQRAEVVVVTDDTALHNEILALVKRKSVTIGRVTYDTAHILPQPSLAFLRDFHANCTLDNPMWFNAVTSFYSHHYIARGRTAPDKVIQNLFRSLDEDLAAKEERQANRAEAELNEDLLRAFEGERADE